MYLLFCRLPINLHCIWAFPFFTFFYHLALHLSLLACNSVFITNARCSRAEMPFIVVFLGVGGTQYYSLKECMVCIDHDLWLIMIAQEIDCSIQNNHLKKSYAEPLSEKNTKYILFLSFIPFMRFAKNHLSWSVVVTFAQSPLSTSKIFHFFSFPFISHSDMYVFKE